MSAGAVIHTVQRPAGWWSRSCDRSCQAPRRRPSTFAPVTWLAQPVECVESYITTGAPPVRSPNHKAMLVRSGTAELSGPFGSQTVAAGDLVLLSAGVVSGSVSLAPVDVCAPTSIQGSWPIKCAGRCPTSVPTGGR